MAEWVLKGSLKGPQGEAGADAQFPEGGTTGDFLQKKADGTGWFNSEGLLRASYVGTLQQLGDEGQSLEIHDVSVTSNGYVAGVSTDNPTEDGAFVYADDKNSSHLGHNRVGVETGVPYVDIETAAGDGTHLAADGRYSYVDDIEAADALAEQGGALTIPTGAAVKRYVADHAGDALPEGGTDGQVLTKTADGEAWETPEINLSYGFVEIASTVGASVGGIGGVELLATNQAGQKTGIRVCDDPGAPAALVCGNKEIYAFESTLSGSDDYVPTSKAVADYVAANAPETDLSGLLDLDLSAAQTINPNEVDILTLEPGTYYVSGGVYDGMVEGEYNNETQFPDAMIGMNEYINCGILSVYKLLAGDGTYSRRVFDLFAINTMSVAVSRYIMTLSVNNSSLNNETIRNSWVKLIPQSDLYDTIFESDTTRPVTGKAVADYVAANASTVKTASNQDFCEYFGMEYNAEDWS